MREPIGRGVAISERTGHIPDTRKMTPNVMPRRNTGSEQDVPADKENGNDKQNTEE